MNRAYQAISVDHAYRIRDNQFWYNECCFADLVRNKTAIVMNIEGLGVRTLRHSAPGKDGRPTSSYKFLSKADTQWWKTHHEKPARLELLSIEGEAEPVSDVATPTKPETGSVPDFINPVLPNISEEVLCIGLDIAWFGGSVNDKDSQFDCLGAAFISPHAGQATSTLTRVPLKNRDLDAVQLLAAIDELLWTYQGIQRVVFALDAPIQAVDCGLPDRSPRPSPGSVKRRACENYFDEQCRHLQKSLIEDNGWRPKIQPGSPLAHRVTCLLNGLQKRGFSLWTREKQHNQKIVIECFPAEAIWAIRQLGYYSSPVNVTCVKAYKGQKGILFSAEQIKNLVHDVLDAFTPVIGSAVDWPSLVNKTISQMLSDPAWQVNGYYRGGKYLDDAVDTMICLVTSLSYAYHLAHVWQDPQHADDGHIIGPGFSNDGKWIAACTDYTGSNEV